MRKKIILVTGDPNSINSELIYKSWKKLTNSTKSDLFLISNFDLLSAQFRKLNYNISLKRVDNISSHFKIKNTIKILNIDLRFKDPFKVPKKSATKFVWDSLNLAHKLGLQKNVAGIINCPINKELLKKKHVGVTEYFASKCSIKDDSEVMVIKSNNLMVSPITTHVDIKSISKRIKRRIIVKKVRTINKWYKAKFSKKPKIALLGLNPHNGELRKLSEEYKIIIPAVNYIQKFNIDLKGPFASDTIFINDYKKYDIIVGMYHDQVLSPFKALFKFDAINLTLGLKYVRVSPDHGVANDKILLKKSNPISLLKCIKYIKDSK
ncbi:4-hydroxythreonine-4-phosphate dehydrogenase PdxA [Pelagibacterales bacterium SAG-MED28]|nr:4-hydroxythreonine-4-phosphate dehydrogenase PdxA [Pelagibacterales bacterium SAG-MED28]